MRLWMTASVLVVCTAALCLVAPTQAMPPAMSTNSGTMIVMEEAVEEAQGVRLGVVGGQPAADAMEEAVDDALDADVRYSVVDEQEEEVDVEVDVEMDIAATSTTEPPPHRRCTLKACWRGCKRHGYNWGLCLCKKCRCFY